MEALLEKLLLDILEGRKKIVVRSVDTPATRPDTDGFRICHDYKHTFHVEESGNG